MLLRTLALATGAALFIGAGTAQAQEKSKADAKAQRQAAVQQCNSMKGQQRDDCQRNAQCSTAKDKAKCEARWNQRRSEREAAAAKCNQMTGADRQKCQDDLKRKK